MNYYNEIKDRLIKSEIFERVKDYSKDRNKVKTYFEIGELLSKAGKEYGKNIIKQYSEKLIIEVGKKYNLTTLYKMRKFYEIFNNEKLSSLRTKLTWSHYRELMRLKNIDEISYYIEICEKNRLTYRQLLEKIKNNEYERLSEEAKQKLKNSEELKINDLVPNPIIIKNSTLNEVYYEYTLKELILNNIDDFLAQLGYGFSYIGKEFKIKLGNRYNYVDILLFNFVYNCFVVVELKVTELKKEHIGQIQVYMNYVDENIKTNNQDKTIGIIICKENNNYVIKYCSDKRIISREYKYL